MVVKWTKILVMESGDEIFWKRDGYDYVGTVVDSNDDGSYYVEYMIDPKTKSWTNVLNNEIDIMRITQRHKPQM